MVIEAFGAKLTSQPAEGRTSRRCTSSTTATTRRRPHLPVRRRRRSARRQRRSSRPARPIRSAPCSRRTRTPTVPTARRAISAGSRPTTVGAGAVDQGRLRLRAHQPRVRRLVDRLRRRRRDQREHAARRMAGESRRDAERADRLRLLRAPGADLQRERVPGARAVRQRQSDDGDRRRDRAFVHAGERLDRLGAAARLQRHDRQHERVLPEQQRAGQRAVRQQQPDQRTAGDAALLRGRSQPQQGPLVARLAGDRQRCRSAAGWTSPGRLPRCDLRPAEQQGRRRPPRWFLHGRRRRQRERVLHLRAAAGDHRRQHLHRQQQRRQRQRVHRHCRATPATPTRRCSSATTTTSWIRAWTGRRTCATSFTPSGSR